MPELGHDLWPTVSLLHLSAPSLDPILYHCCPLPSDNNWVTIRGARYPHLLPDVPHAFQKARTSPAYTCAFLARTPCIYLVTLEKQCGLSRPWVCLTCEVLVRVIKLNVVVSSIRWSIRDGAVILRNNAATPATRDFNGVSACGIGNYKGDDRVIVCNVIDGNPR